MAIHSKKEFAQICGLTTPNLSNYIKRGKVILSDQVSDHIDDGEPMNAAFVEHRKALIAKKSARKSVETAQSTKKSAAKPEKKQPNPGNESTSQDENSDIDVSSSVIPGKDQLEGMSLTQLAEHKTRADILRIKSVTELNKLKIERQEGESIPFALVQPILLQMSKSLTTAFKNGADNLLVEISHRLKLSNAETAQFRERLIFIINEANQKAVADAKKQSVNLSSEFEAK